MSRHKPQTLRCTSAWIAFEQYNRLTRKGWKVSVLNHAGESVTIGRLQVAAQAESGAFVTGTDRAGGPPTSARNLLMGS